MSALKPKIVVTPPQRGHTVCLSLHQVPYVTDWVNTRVFAVRCVTVMTT